MKKLAKQVIAVITLFIFIISTLSLQPVYAAESATVSVSSKSVDTRDDFSVTISINASSTITAAQVWVTYDTSVIQLTSSNAGGSGTAYVISSGESSMTLNFKAIAPGTSALSISNTVVSIGNDIVTSDVSVRSGSVTVSAPASYSTDNSLSSLEISPGVLSPAFSSNVTSYTTSVDADCSQLIVNAIANDSAAKVSISGRKLDPGTNTTTITVTAEDGSTRKYVITTTKASSDNSAEQEAESATTGSDESTDENESVEEETESAKTLPNVKVDDAEYSINNDFSAHPLPSGYEESQLDYNGSTITVGKGVNTKLILMYLESVDGNGTSGFYVYDSVNKTFTLYTEVAQPQITYVILPITDQMEKPEGYRLTTYTINDKRVSVLMDDKQRFCLFYGVSSTGETGWFRYDISDGTIQSYTDSGSTSESVDSTAVESSDRMWMLIAIGTSCAAGILLVAVIVLAIKASRNKQRLLDAIKTGSGGDSYEDDSDDDLLADNYEEDSDSDDLNLDLDEDAQEEQADDQNEDQKAEKEAEDFRSAKERYQKEVAATIAPTIAPTMERNTRKEENQTEDAKTSAEDDMMFNAVASALEKNLSEGMKANSKISDETEELDFLDIEEMDDRN